MGAGEAAVRWGLGTRTVGDPLGDGDEISPSWSSRAQPSAVWSYTMCLGAANTRRRRAAGNPESVASAFSREPRDRIVAPVAAGLTELDGLVPGPLAAEDAKYREAARAGGGARTGEDRGFGAPTFAHATRQPSPRARARRASQGGAGVHQEETAAGRVQVGRAAGEPAPARSRSAGGWYALRRLRRGCVGV